MMSEQQWVRSAMQHAKESCQIRDSAYWWLDIIAEGSAWQTMDNVLQFMKIAVHRKRKARRTLSRLLNVKLENENLWLGDYKNSFEHDQFLKSRRDNLTNGS